MGTCCSKNPPYKSPATDSDPPTPEDRAPPLPVEEETVKEVLSETAKPSIAKIRDKSEAEAEAETETEEKKHPRIYINGGDAASDFSEICSLSESISATTTTAEMMKAEYEGEVGMRLKDSASPAKFQRRRTASAVRRDAVGRSPSKRSEFSPVKRMPVREGIVNRPWIPAGTNGVRRDFGENSGRRSPSPARRMDLARSDLSRTASARKTGRSPRRAQGEDGGRNVEERAEGNESLENPLVSLECFIFL
ncbi:hypothetical protein MRB53_021829 [Persea americana]|uniref:Uncharacterized protein n=1 Tax=Persea americana TaxID=3435 RepID=A0ACC2L5A1_PERAE|nr:hypothetical protein MRB53_021829 [Persea americana]